MFLKIYFAAVTMRPTVLLGYDCCRSSRPSQQLSPPTRLWKVHRWWAWGLRASQVQQQQQQRWTLGWRRSGLVQRWMRGMKKRWMRRSRRL